MRRIILLTIFVVTAMGLKANVVINKANRNGKIDLAEHFFVYEDPTNTLTIDDAISERFFRNFSQSASDQINIGGGRNNMWVLIDINNTTNENFTAFLTLDNPLITEIIFYNGIDSTTFNTGLLYPYQRYVYSQYFTFKINLEPKQKGRYCIKLSKQTSLCSVKLEMWSRDSFMNEGNTQKRTNGFAYGLVIAVLIISLMSYLSERNKMYISNALLLLSTMLLALWYDTTLFKYLTPDTPANNIMMFHFIVPAAFAAFAYYTKWNFTPKKSNHRYTSPSMIITYVCIIATIVNMLSRLRMLFTELICTLILAVLAYFIYCVVTTERRTDFFKLRVGVSALILAEMSIKYFFYSSSIGYLHSDEDFAFTAMMTTALLLLYIFGRKFVRARSEYIKVSQNMEEGIKKRTELINLQKEELSSQREELIQQRDTLQTQREELRAQKELLQMRNADLSKISTVTNMSNNMIVIYKPNGDIDWYNAAYGKRLNIDIEDYKFLEKPINVTTVSSNKNLKHVIASVLKEKNVVAYESEMKNENDQRWLQTTLTPILDDNDEVKLIISVDTDITQIKQYEKKIEQQKNEAETQRNLALVQKNEIENRQNEMFGSIRYAKRIQTSILPKPKQIHRDFNDSFVLFMPKDIVSGDFYWYHRIENKYFIAAVDCTGHGVPGAFLSIIGSYLLNSIVIHNGIHTPADILKNLNRKIKISLKSDSQEQNNDGMDIAFAVIDKELHTLEYSGAMRPLYLFNHNGFEEIKGDKIPISSNITGTSINTTYYNNVRTFNPGDQFYIFSDGITDQFGGDDGKKYLTRRFKDLLESIKDKPMREQKDLIRIANEEWRGTKYDQVDDILVIGIRYTTMDL